MFFFEVLLEYIFLEQNNSTNTRVLERKELYNKPVKDMVFGLNPELATRFSLKNFHASAEEIDKYLCDHKNLIRGYTQGSFPSHLIKRLAQYIESYTLLRPDNLKGHVLFRDFDEREYLEIELAKRLWDEAQRKEVTIVTYRLPKGEIGLMPGKISSYVAKCCSKGYKRGEALSLKLDNKLAVRNTAMRDPYTKQGTL
jgi:hypothetical protein